MTQKKNFSDSDIIKPVRELLDDNELDRIVGGFQKLGASPTILAPELNEGVKKGVLSQQQVGVFLEQSKFRPLLSFVPGLAKLYQGTAQEAGIKKKLSELGVKQKIINHFFTR